MECSVVWERRTLVAHNKRMKRPVTPSTQSTVRPVPMPMWTIPISALLFPKMELKTLNLSERLGTGGVETLSGCMLTRWDGRTATCLLEGLHLSRGPVIPAPSPRTN